MPPIPQLGVISCQNDVTNSTIHCWNNNSISPLGEEIISMHRALFRLNAILPMTSHRITRVGQTGVWNVVAVTKDARTYTKTLTLVGSSWHITLIALTNALPTELAAFLDVTNAFMPYLNTLGIGDAYTTWS